MHQAARQKRHADTSFSHYPIPIHINNQTHTHAHTSTPRWPLSAAGQQLSFTPFLTPTPTPVPLALFRSWLFPAGAAACASRLLATPASALGVRTRAALLALPEGLYGGGGGGGGGAGGAAGGGVAPHLALLGQLVARTEAALLRTFR